MPEDFYSKLDAKKELPHPPYADGDNLSLKVRWLRIIALRVRTF
jgi:hypothetical protein